MQTKVKTEAEIVAMREGGKMLATVLSVLKKQARAGMTTKDLADLAAKELKSLGGSPAFLGYQGYPDVLCVSVNDEVVHGIPNRDIVLDKGDIVGLDFGVFHKGMITDGAISVIIDGSSDKRLNTLLDMTERSLLNAIDVVRSGCRVGDIAAAAQSVLDKAELGIVRDLVGHGVGHHLHEDPNIPNTGHAGTGPVLKSGMTIAIEPMATLGGYGVYIDRDGWTVKTIDGSMAAHFEHTILVTDDGAEILTAL